MGKKKFHTLITSMFSHKDLSHFAMNMLTLYFVGSGVAPALGAARVLGLYLSGGVFSGLCFIFSPRITDYFKGLKRPRWSGYDYRNRALGASGAINTIMAYYLLCNPTGTVYLYMVVPVPVVVFGVGYMAWQVMAMKSSDHAASAHIGGAVFGAAYWALRRLRYIR